MTFTSPSAFFWITGSQNVVLRPVAPASPAELFERRCLIPHLRPTESETLEMNLTICLLTSPLGDSGTY